MKIWKKEGRKIRKKQKKRMKKKEKERKERKKKKKKKKKKGKRKGERNQYLRGNERRTNSKHFFGEILLLLSIILHNIVIHSLWKESGRGYEKAARNKKKIEKKKKEGGK